jgi:hypothetical protein
VHVLADKLDRIPDPDSGRLESSEPIEEGRRPQVIVPARADNHRIKRGPMLRPAVPDDGAGIRPTAPQLLEQEPIIRREFRKCGAARQTNRQSSHP